MATSSPATPAATLTHSAHFTAILTERYPGSREVHTELNELRIAVEDLEEGGLFLQHIMNRPGEIARLRPGAAHLLVVRTKLDDKTTEKRSCRQPKLRWFRLGY